MSMYARLVSNPTESPMTYEQQNEFGREIAASAVAECLESGNQPKLVRMIRDMAGQDTGVSIGFLYSIAERVVK